MALSYLGLFFFLSFFLFFFNMSAFRGVDSDSSFGLQTYVAKKSELPLSNGLLLYLL